MQESLINPWEHKPAQPLGKLILAPPNKTEKQTANYNHIWTVQGAGEVLNLYQGKGVGQGAKLSIELSVKHRKGSEG
jgi:hypothetical protein